MQHEYRSERVRFSEALVVIMGTKVAQWPTTTCDAKDRMAFITHRQHMMALGMTVLLLAAVVAPVCVMFAQPAMAMPMSMPAEQPASAPQDCDEESGSIAECPHASPNGAPATVPRADGFSDAALPAAAGTIIGPIDRGPVEAPTCVGQLPPPAHLTPLRL